MTVSRTRGAAMWGLVIGLMAGCGGSGAEPAPRTRWSETEARAWYAEQPWLIGANFIPSTAVNQLEMWQAETYDEPTIDRELGWAEDLGFNTMRVFLHDLLWADDPEGFLERIDRFLGVADRHGMRIMFVFFDGVWNPFPVAGPQPDPIPHVHNSQWVQSPGAEILGDLERHDELEPYVTGVIGRFAADPRVLAWDLFNEPDNPNLVSYREVELPPEVKDPAAEALLRKAFVWARSVGPTQPLTAGLWQGQWADASALSPLNELMVTESDVVSFHSYDGPELVTEQLAALGPYGRPLLCTEYMARPGGSTFQAILPIFEAQDVAAYNWGLVSGKTQTIYTWLSWITRSPDDADPWFHDIFYPDGTPYDPEEVAFIRELTGR
ncbi:MAG: cellulase family glycosylhydrolase [Myxococcales bacterium]